MARRIELDIFIASYTGVDCKWIADLKAIIRIRKVLEENKGVHRHERRQGHPGTSTGGHGDLKLGFITIQHFGALVGTALATCFVCLTQARVIWKQ